MNKQQLTNLLGAGTISALAVALALMFGGRGPQTADTVPAQDTTNVVTEVDPLAEQNAQLLEAVEVLQAREVDYQTQLTTAQEALNAQVVTEVSYAEGEEADETDEEEESEEEDDDD